MKRFQECNKIEKIFRYRWYLLIPFIYLYYQFRPFKVYEDEVIDGELIHTDNYFVLKGYQLWRTIKSTLQSKMKWYYTHEEVLEKFKHL
jgi:hypothetical protein